MTTDRTGIADLSPGLGHTSSKVDGLDFVAMRVFDAPRELVFRAFTDCRYLSQWWGPAGWTLPVCEIDFRPGGTWFYGMQGPNGELSHGKMHYTEIVEPERIVCTDVFAQRDGSPIPGMPEIVFVITFSEQGGKTTLSSRATFASAADIETVLAMGMVEGLTQTWDRLEAFLAESPA
jgi:uncharacterized protein YndB with AHSA1/START domain